jgi:hypothetical protein
VIENPELRKMLEEEAIIARKEYQSIQPDTIEELKKRRKLMNRCEEIERLLGLRVHHTEVLLTQHAWFKRVLAVLVVVVICILVLYVYEAKTWRAEVQRIENMVLEHTPWTSHDGEGSTDN